MHEFLLKVQYKYKKFSKNRYLLLIKLVVCLKKFENHKSFSKYLKCYNKIINKFFIFYLNNKMIAYHQS